MGISRWLYECFLTIGRHESMILNISDLIAFLSIETHTIDFLIENDIV